MSQYGKLKDLHREKQNFTARSIVAILFCLTAATLLVFRLVDLQVLKQDYYATRADENRMRLSPVPPVRGLVFDRNNVMLAQNTPAFVLEVVPEQVEDMDGTIARLSTLLRISDSDIVRFKDRVRKSPRYRGVPLRSNLTLEEVAQYEINRYEFKGVDVTAGLTRNYPLGASASHVIGYVGGITENELKQIDERMYQGLSQIGKIGVENSQEERLRGTPGAKIIEANAYGRPLRELDYQVGAPGHDLILSLDAKVQLAAETALGELDGAVVAIDPRNGEVIALLSKPGFDPALFVEGIDVKTYKEFLTDPKRPLYNRALQGTYPPGSTIKPFMALAGLEAGNLDPAHGEYCRGEYTLPGSSRKYRCHKRQGHGWMDLNGALVKSCDVYFYQVAQTLGIDRIHDFLDHFGLGRRTAIDLPLEKGGLLPSRAWKRRVRKEVWYPGETLSIGIGQGYMTFTPLQLAQATARIAMRGAGFKPHVVHAERDPITGVSFPVNPEPLPPIPNPRPDEWELVVDAMEDTVQTEGGTGYKAFKGAAYLAAGKSGTAQVAGMSQEENKARELDVTPYHLRDHGLFIAFAPADDPQIAVAVIAEHAGHGGATAGPIARQVIDQYLLGEVQYKAPEVKPPPGTPAPVTPVVPAVAPPAPSTTP